MLFFQKNFGKEKIPLIFATTGTNKHSETMYYTVTETYETSSCDPNVQTFVVENRKTAVKLANELIESFIKTALEDGFEKEDFYKYGDFKTGNTKTVSLDIREERVDIQEAFFVKDFKTVRRFNEYGEGYHFEVDIEGETIEEKVA